jgi:copper chaperone CopZ
MNCEACRTTIARALEALPGVVAVSVDLDRKLVRVEHDYRLTPPDRLATAVEGQGYEVAVCAVP